jgi:hypothetical protein
MEPGLRAGNTDTKPKPATELTPQRLKHVRSLGSGHMEKRSSEASQGENSD